MTTRLTSQRIRISPKIFQRWPLVRLALRCMLAIGPAPSSTQTGNATDHITSSITPGTINNIKPTMIPRPMRMERPRIGKNLASPFCTASPMLAGWPRKDWNAM